MIGTAILFGNASCKEAVSQLPPTSLQDSFAVSFVGVRQESPQGTAGATTEISQEEAQKRVRGIAELKVHCKDYRAQLAALRTTNKVYRHATENAAATAEWVKNGAEPKAAPV